MEQRHVCHLCRYEHRVCKCTPEELQRDADERELDQARERVAYLERKLGVKHASGGNRAQRRASAAQAKKR